MSTPVSLSSSLLKLSFERRKVLREANIAARTTLIDDEQLGNLDSSIKKNTAFTKRLRNVTAETFEPIMTEFYSLKLTKFVEEAAVCLLENKMKNASDVAALVEIISSFHQRYFACFTGSYLNGLDRLIASSFLSKDDEERPAWLVKQRQLLRLQAELCLVGIIRDPLTVFKFLRQIIPEDDVEGPVYLPIITSFVKSLGPFYVKTVGEDSQIYDHFVSLEWRKKFNDAIHQYFKAMSRLLVRLHQKVISLEQRGRQHYETRGDLSTDQALQLQTSIEQLEKLRCNLQTLADQLDLRIPDLQQVEAPEIVEGKIVFADPHVAARQEESKSIIYDSEEDRSFYEDIVNLGDTVHDLLLTGSGSRAGSEEQQPEATNEDENSEEDLSGFADIDPDADQPSWPMTEHSDWMHPDDQKKSANTKIFFEKLQNMRSRSLVDQAAIDFCHINSKSTRKKLAETLVELPRKRLELLPFIGRFLATIKRYFPDVATAVGDSLIGQYIFLFHQKNPLLGTRSRVCRYIGELTKFGVMSQGKTFALMKKTVIDDLAGYNVEMAAILLESCGRFLFHQAATHKRLLYLFELINKKKGTGSLDIAQIVTLDNAIYICNPPDRPIIAKEPKPPRLQFLFKLVRNDLGNPGCPSSSPIDVAVKLLKFPWDEAPCRSELLRALSKPYKLKYGNIALLAKVIEALSKYYPSIVCEAIDEIVEAIRTGLDANSIKYYQRTLALIKFVAELFNVKLIGDDLVFFLLNQLVTYGHCGIPRVINTAPVDPPQSFFRVRLIATLLISCARNLPRSSFFEQFMMLFEYYVATKGDGLLPLEIDDLMNDLYEYLDRPRPEAFDFEKTTRRLVQLSHKSMEFLLEDLKVQVGEGSCGGNAEGGETEDPTPSLSVIVVDEFDKAFSGMITMGLEERKLKGRTSVFDAPLPLGMVSQPASPMSEEGSSVGKIKLMIKKKNKTTIKNVIIDPKDAAFIQGSQNLSAGKTSVMIDSINNLEHPSSLLDEESVRGKKGKGAATLRLYGKSRHT